MQQNTLKKIHVFGVEGWKSVRAKQKVMKVLISLTCRHLMLFVLWIFCLHSGEGQIQGQIFVWVGR